jgi:hypothetical protein
MRISSATDETDTWNALKHSKMASQQLQQRREQRENRNEKGIEEESNDAEELKQKEDVDIEGEESIGQELESAVQALEGAVQEVILKAKKKNNKPGRPTIRDQKLLGFYSDGIGRTRKLLSKKKKNKGGVEDVQSTDLSGKIRKPSKAMRPVSYFNRVKQGNKSTSEKYSSAFRFRPGAKIIIDRISALLMSRIVKNCEKNISMERKVKIGERAVRAQINMDYPPNHARAILSYCSNAVKSYNETLPTAKTKSKGVLTEAH